MYPGKNLFDKMLKISHMKKLALILGGGGAKSFAHLGVIKVLQENNIPIDLLVTCSGGSIIGALIANGASVEKIKKEFYKKTRRINWFTLKLSRKGLLSQKNIQSILEHLKADTNIEDTKIPIRIVATNLNLGELKIFKSGSLKKAVCASVAFPGIYKPVKIGDYFFIDGGVLNSIPADIGSREIGCGNVTVTINLDYILNGEINKSNVFQIIHRSIYIPMISQRKEIVKKNSDVIIEPFKNKNFGFRNSTNILRFYSAEKMEVFYQLGIKEAIKKIDQIKLLLKD